MIEGSLSFKTVNLLLLHSGNNKVTSSASREQYALSKKQSSLSPEKTTAPSCRGHKTSSPSHRIERGILYTYIYPLTANSMINNEKEAMRRKGRRHI